MAAKGKCVTKGCGREIRCRGICASCYFTMRNSIKAGKISGWEYLVKLGLALEPHATPARKAIQKAERTAKRSRAVSK
jgi:hypothetical protein